jgi:threonine dehydrogenase-like Zn-dependent dehydrogenase
MAQRNGAEIINFNNEDPVQILRDLTNGSGVDRVIDAVGVDAAPPAHGSKEEQQKFSQEMKSVAPRTSPSNGNWEPGGAPSQALVWGVEALAKAGTLSIIGVYPPNLDSFPIGKVMNKNITVKAGNCNHRRYMPLMIELVRSGVIRPEEFLTQQEPLISAIDAYRSFDSHQNGWVKVKLEPATKKKQAA